MLLWMLRCMYLFKVVLFCFVKYPRVELFGHTVALFLVFWETSISFSAKAALIYIVTKSVHFLFSTSLQAFVICVLSHNSHSDRYEVISHCRFDLCFPDDQQCWTLFHVPISHLYVFFGKNKKFFQVFCLLLIRLLFYHHWTVVLFIYFGYEPLISPIIYKYILWLTRLSFWFYQLFPLMCKSL